MEPVSSAIYELLTRQMKVDARPASRHSHENDIAARAHLSEPREFAEMLDKGGLVRRLSITQGIESTDMNVLPVLLEPNNPSISSGSAVIPDPLHGVVGAVHSVLALGRQSKIANAVVAFDAVDMIDERRRPLTVDKVPSKTMSFDRPVTMPDDDVTTRMQGARNIAHPDLWTRGNMGENAGIRVVRQPLPQKSIPVHLAPTPYERLMRQAIANGRAATRTVDGMIARPGGTGAADVKGPDPKARPVYREEMRQSRPEGETVGFNYVVHMNHAVPTSTRKTARRRTSAAFLMVVK